MHCECFESQAPFALNLLEFGGVRAVELRESSTWTDLERAPPNGLGLCAGCLAGTVRTKMCYLSLDILPAALLTRGACA